LGKPKFIRRSMATPEIQGRGFIYWSKEREATGPSFSRSWMHITVPPFYTGRGVRLRIKKIAFHIGIYWKNKNPIVKDIDATPEEIRQWG
jgi:hypothetical protein